MKRCNWGCQLWELTWHTYLKTVNIRNAYQDYPIDNLEVELSGGWMPLDEAIVRGWIVTDGTKLAQACKDLLDQGWYFAGGTRE